MGKIDVIIPAIEKDLEVLPHVIDSARKQIKHPIGEIFVVAPESKQISNLSIKKKCVFVNENSVLPVTKDDMNYFPKRKSVCVDRSGWLFQQMLKLSGDLLSDKDGYLVLDADTVLIRPHIFERNGKSVFFLRKLYYKPYFETYKKLMGEEAAGPAQTIFFVSHYMYFRTKWVREMKKFIEAKHNTEWYTAILKCMNKKKWDSFSEFETFGNYMLKKHPDKIILKPRRNLSLKRSSIENFSKINVQDLVKKYGIRSISFHSWKK